MMAGVGVVFCASFLHALVHSPLALGPWLGFRALTEVGVVAEAVPVGVGGLGSC